MSSAAPMFMVRIAGKGEYGPMSSAQLQSLAADGTVDPRDRVQQVGSAVWWPASSIEGLFPAQPPPLPTLSQSAAEKAWRLYASDREYGPFTTSQMRQLAAEGRLAQETLVRERDDVPWAPAGTLPELFPAAETTGAPPLEDGWRTSDVRPTVRKKKRDGWLWALAAFGLAAILTLIVWRAGPWSTEPDPPEPEKIAVREPRPPEPVRLAESIDIRVTSQRVQRMKGWHRYVFTIKNHDSKPFEGDINISLLNVQPNLTNGHETFATKTPLAPNGEITDYMDIVTGPVSVLRESGVAKFRFNAMSKGAVVASGEGDISEICEDSPRN